MPSKPAILYRLLKAYVPVVLKLFYRRIHVMGKENVPAKGPVIFAANHQNAFMDAIVVAVSTPRNPWFLTRASVFSSALVRFWLHQLQMIPIYRFRDGMAGMKRNDETFEKCSWLLKQNQCILIFPEGNHDSRWTLRPLQKGLARIAFASLEQTEPGSSVQIIPVGLQYEDIYRSYSDLLISFGKAIPVSEYAELHHSDPAAATNNLMQKVQRSISDLIVDIKPTELYEFKKLALVNRPKRERPLELRLAGDKKFLVQWTNRSGSQQADPKPTHKAWCAASTLVLLPHLPAIWTVRTIVNAVVKDPHWTTSIKFAAFAFATPLIYLAELYVLSRHFQGWLWIAPAIFILLVSGRVGLHMRDRCRGIIL